MNLAVCGTIAKNANNHVKPARIAKPAKDVRGVSSQAPVSVRQPGLQPGENTHVVRRDDRLSGSGANRNRVGDDEQCHDSYQSKSCSKVATWTGNRGIVCPLVFELQAELSRSGHHNERTGNWPGPHDDSSMGAALHARVREAMERLYPAGGRFLAV